MDRDELYGRLAQTKHLVEDAAARFATLTDGHEHPRIDTARDRLSVSAIALTRAAGGLSAWTRTGLGMAAIVGPVWAVAAVARDLLHLPAGWVITIAVVSLVALTVPVERLTTALAGRVNRRRIGRPELALRSSTVDSSEDVLAELWAARDVLTALMRDWSSAHRHARLAQTPAGFDWLRRHDRHLFYASLADRCICQAIDSIEIWLDVREGTR